MLSCNGRPGTRQGGRPPHRGAVLPVDAYSLAVACGSRGVSRDIWPASLSAPAAPRAVRLSGHDRDRSPSRTTRRATTWFPPRRSARQARSPRASAAVPAVVVRPPPRATANSAYGAFAMRRPPMLRFAARHWGSTLGAAITRRALRPGNVASGDRCVRGTLAPRHHAGTNILLSKALGATGRKADLAPRHYRIPPPGDMPRRTTSAASGRRPVVTGRCASRRPPDEHHHGAHHRLVGAGRLHAGPVWSASRRTLRPRSTASSRPSVADRDLMLAAAQKRSSSPGRLLARGPHQNRTRRLPPSGSSADVPRGYPPHIRTTTRGRGRGKRSSSLPNRSHVRRVR